MRISTLYSVYYNFYAKHEHDSSCLKEHRRAHNNITMAVSLGIGNVSYLEMEMKKGESIDPETFDSE